MEKYKHTQAGWVIVGTAIAVFALLALTMPRGATPLSIAVPCAIVFIALGLFTRLTVSIDEEYLRLAFTYSVIKFKIKLDTIESVRQVRTKWYNGWGIHGFCKQWLFNVSGFDAVEVKTKDGRMYWIGTDDPEGLIKAIREVVK